MGLIYNEKATSLPIVLTLFAFCCTPYYEPAVKVQKQDNVEYSGDYSISGLLDAIIKEQEIDNSLLVVQDPDVYIASMTCVPQLETCMLSFNAQRLQNIKFVFGNTPVAWILAHEVAHIKQILSGFHGKIKDLEYEADKRAGCTVKRLGFDARHMEGFIYRWLHEDEGHYGEEKRLEAFKKGYSCE